MNKKIKIFGKKIKLSHMFLAAVMLIIAFIIIAPFLWVFSASLRASYSEATALPPKWLPPAFQTGIWRIIKSCFPESSRFSDLC